MSDKESAAMATMSTRAEAVRLTPTERRLLTCLVRNAGRIVSHGELLEEMSPPRCACRSEGDTCARRWLAK